MKSRSGAPIMFRVARSMGRSQVRGGSFLMRQLTRRGILNVVAKYQLGNNITFGVPLCHLPWDYHDVVNYEKKLIDVFCDAIAPLQDVVLFDCGADIGTFSVLICSRAEQVGTVVAFEPNADVLEFLRSNLSNLPVSSELVPSAVGNFTGAGRLERPAYDTTAHARFLLPGDGPINVTTIDSRNVRGGDVAIKLDIEGGELEALKGAAQTIVSARRCVVVVEAHPAVVKRTGRDPLECMKYLQSLRPFQFTVAETGERPSLSSPLLKDDQVDVWNVVGRA